MALINCPECNQLVSDSAKQCPHCGFPLVTDISALPADTPQLREKKLSKMSTAMVAFIGILCYLVLSVLLGMGRTWCEEPEEKLIYDIGITALICTIITWIIDKSFYERVLYSFCILTFSGICALGNESLGFGTAFVLYAVEIGLIIIASYVRNRPAPETLKNVMSNKSVKWAILFPIMVVSLFGASFYFTKTFYISIKYKVLLFYFRGLAELPFAFLKLLMYWGLIKVVIQGDDMQKRKKANKAGIVGLVIGIIFWMLILFIDNSLEYHWFG